MFDLDGITLSYFVMKSNEKFIILQKQKLITMGVKKEKTLVSVYIPKDLKEVLEKQADRENRSLSNLLSIVIKEYATKKA